MFCLVLLSYIGFCLVCVYHIGILSGVVFGRVVDSSLADGFCVLLCLSYWYFVLCLEEWWTAFWQMAQPELAPGGYAGQTLFWLLYVCVLAFLSLSFVV